MIDYRERYTFLNDTTKISNQLELVAPIYQNFFNLAGQFPILNHKVQGSFGVFSEHPSQHLFKATVATNSTPSTP